MSHKAALKTSKYIIGYFLICQNLIDNVCQIRYAKNFSQINRQFTFNNAYIIINTEKIFAINKR